MLDILRFKIRITFVCFYHSQQIMFGCCYSVAEKSIIYINSHTIIVKGSLFFWNYCSIEKIKCAKNHKLGVKCQVLHLFYHASIVKFSLPYSYGVKKSPYKYRFPYLVWQCPYAYGYFARMITNIYIHISICKHHSIECTITQSYKGKETSQG